MLTKIPTDSDIDSDTDSDTDSDIDSDTDSDARILTRILTLVLTRMPARIGVPCRGRIPHAAACPPRPHLGCLPSPLHSPRLAPCSHTLTPAPAGRQGLFNFGMVQLQPARPDPAAATPETAAAAAAVAVVSIDSLQLPR